jgi:hypothetical protein
VAWGPSAARWAQSLGRPWACPLVPPYAPKLRPTVTPGAERLLEATDGPRGPRGGGEGVIGGHPLTLAPSERPLTFQP